MNYAALGLTVYEDFIAPEEETALLAHVQSTAPAHKRKVHLRNSIRRYGSREPYFDNLVSAVIPPHFAELCDRLVTQKLVDARPDSVTVNEYYEGQTIAPHIDHVDGGPVITILSLGVPATMIFAKADETFELILPPRSLVQLRQQIRYSWTHAIAPVTGLRYSIVFRNSADCLRK